MHVVRFKHDEGQKLLHLWRKDRTGNKIVLFYDFIHFNYEYNTLKASYSCPEKK